MTASAYAALLALPETQRPSVREIIDRLRGPKREHDCERDAEYQRDTADMDALKEPK